VSLALQNALAKLPSNDTILAQTLRRIPTVVARAGIADGEAQSASKNGQTPVVIVGENPVVHLHSYARHLTNLPELEAAAFGRGYLNDTRDTDGVVRSVPLLFGVNGEVAPTLGVELLRVATGESRYSVHGSRHGVSGVQIANSFIPNASDGSIRLHFSPAYAARRVSAGAILRGEIGPNAFANQVAIIGVTAITGRNIVHDERCTPVEASAKLRGTT